MVLIDTYDALYHSHVVPYIIIMRHYSYNGKVKNIHSYLYIYWYNNYMNKKMQSWKIVSKVPIPMRYTSFFPFIHGIIYLPMRTYYTDKCYTLLHDFSNQICIGIPVSLILINMKMMNFLRLYPDYQHFNLVVFLYSWRLFWPDYSSRHQTSLFWCWCLWWIIWFYHWLF